MKFKDLSIAFNTNKVKECIDFYTKYFEAVLAFDSEREIADIYKDDIK